MKRSPPEILNKEKVLFLAVALIFSAGLYRVFTSAPLPLEPGKPFTEKSGPDSLQMDAANPTLAERDYFYGSRNPLLKPKAPALALQKIPRAPSGGIPPPPIEQSVQAGEHAVAVKKLLELKTLDLEYMGIVIADGKSCAFLRSKSSGSTMRVRSDETIAGTTISVTKIEPWAVWLSDGNGVGVLKNERFDAQPESASRAVKSRNREPSVFF